MATNLTPTPAAPTAATTDKAPARRGSLLALARKLAALTEPPTLEQMAAWLRELRVGKEELRPYLCFRPGTYMRRRVFRNAAVEMLVLSWQPGHQTAIHDHNGSVGVIRVERGEMSEEMFARDAGGVLRPKSECRHGRGEISGAAVPNIHRIGNPADGAENMVTIHMYAPPLTVLNTYKLDSREVGQCWPDDPALPANAK